MANSSEGGGDAAAAAASGSKTTAQSEDNRETEENKNKKTMPPNEAQPGDKSGENAEGAGVESAGAAAAAGGGGGDDSKMPLQQGEDDATKVKFSSNDAKLEMGAEGKAADPYPALTKSELLKYAEDPFWVRLRWALFILFWLVWVAMLAASVAIIWTATKCPSPAPKQWWQKEPVYEVLVKSFKDSDDNGKGDIRGVTSKADYLASLGIGSVWLSPIYPSGGRDNGYDIKDFKAVDEQFGTMEHFEELVAALHERDIKLIMDFVPNHSSDEHEWFVESAKGGDDNKYKDYYVWEGDNSRSPPNNWKSVFGGSAWEWNSQRRQWYLHQFFKEQPDLNVRNPEVVKELEDILKFWMEKGVDGFRMDAVAHLFEDPEFRSEPVLRAGSDKYDSVEHKYTYNLPETLELLRKFRKVLDAKTEEDDDNPRIMMTEAYLSTKDLLPYYGNNASDISHLPLNFGFMELLKDRDDIHPHALEKNIKDYLKALNGSWPNFNLGNHDKPRIASVGGDERVDLLNMVYMLMPGTPVTYYGEEIGMVNGRNLPSNRPNADSRDEARTPMQWNSNENAGFTGSGVEPWLPVNPDYKEVNVQKQDEADGWTHLKVYRKLTHVRTHKSILFGSTDTYVDGDVFAFNRVKKGNPGYLVVVNLGETDRHNITLKAPEPEGDEEKGEDKLPYLPGSGSIHCRSTPRPQAKSDPSGGNGGDAATDGEKQEEEQESKSVDFASFNLKAFEGIVVTFVPDFS